MREHDPLGAWLRDTRAQRRVGRAPLRLRRGAAVCIDYGPFAADLLSLRRVSHGRPPYEVNHVFGKRNSPRTIRYPINDHRAIFNVKQLDWTPDSLENPTATRCSNRWRGSTGWTITSGTCWPTAF